MLRTRILSAAVLLPIVAILLYVGGWPFLLLVLLVAGLSAYEFYTLLSRADHQPNILLGLAMIGLLIMRSAPPFTQPSVRTLLDTVFTGMLLASLIWHMMSQGRPAPGTDWATTIAGVLYLGWLPAHFVALRAHPDGLWWLALTLISTWITDSGAYFIGRRWGRRKLAPRLSPKKTWEGAIGGWLIGFILTPIIAWGMGLSAWHGLVIGALVATIAPFGDLAESMFKRQVGAKDSSHLIPGHGGMLDRIDSLLFVVPAVYYYVSLAANY